MNPEIHNQIDHRAIAAQGSETALSIESGAEWIVDATGCDPQSIQNLPLLQELCARVVDDLGLHVLGSPQWHQFPDPGGVTGLYLLSESHLAIHTYPEFELLTLNLYCCRSRADWPWKAELQQRVGANRVTVRHVVRGVSCQGGTP